MRLFTLSLVGLMLVSVTGCSTIQGLRKSDDNIIPVRKSGSKAPATVALKGPAPAPGDPQWEAAQNSIAVRGVVTQPNGAYLAVVQGNGITKVGDVITVTYADWTYLWTIKKISKTGVAVKRGKAYPSKNRKR